MYPLINTFCFCAVYEKVNIPKGFQQEGKFRIYMVSVPNSNTYFYFNSTGKNQHIDMITTKERLVLCSISICVSFFCGILLQNLVLLEKVIHQFVLTVQFVSSIFTHLLFLFQLQSNVVVHIVVTRNSTNNSESNSKTC